MVRLGDSSRNRSITVAALLVSAIALGVVAVAQDAVDRDAYARDYVRFLVVQLDQWSKELPQEFDQAVMRPPIDANKLSPAAKASAGELGDAIHRMASLTSAKDLLTNAQFRDQLEKSLASAKELNQAMASQRFPARLQSDWDQVRSNLNNLARVYKLETLAFLEPPAGGGGGGRGGRQVVAAAAAPGAGGGVTGYIVDLMCAKRGKGMWTNAECIARCLRDGDKLVLVTEEGKVYQISNQDKITPESYGQVVTLSGKTEGETITIDSIRL